MWQSQHIYFHATATLSLTLLLSTSVQPFLVRQHTAYQSIMEGAVLQKNNSAKKILKLPNAADTKFWRQHTGEHTDKGNQSLSTAMWN